MNTFRCSVGSMSDDPCPRRAEYHAPRWGDVSRDLELCEPHARECVSDGWRVIVNATGDDLEP